MGFISRLLGRQESGLSASSKAVHPATKRQQPSSPASGSFASDCFGGRPAPPAPVKVVQNVAQVEADVESDDEETIHIPRPISAGDRGRNNSNGRRRAALDICPAAVQRLADKVMTLEEQHYRTSLDGDTGDGITRLEIEQLYSDLQLIHRGRSSMIYRAREVRTGQRVILKAYDSARLTPTKRQNLDRQIRSLKAALCLLGPQGGAVALERVVENPSGVYLVLQACNGGTLIEAIANSGGKLPERQVAMKIALPLLSALARLHGRGIVHRDIKPEHLMIHNGNLKIGDFGNAGCMFGVATSPAVATHVVAAHASEPVSDSKQRLQQQRVPVYGQAQQHQQRISFGKADTSPNTVSLTVAANGVCLDPPSQVHDVMNFRTGSIEYMAPEMLDKPTSAEVFHLVIGQGIDEDELPAYDQKVDVWSLGVVMYEALTGLQPFLADNAAEMASVISTKLLHRVPAAGGREQQWPAFIARLPVTADAKDFIASCLTADPTQRPTAQQLLEHKWLQVMQEQAAAVTANRAASRRVSLASRGSYSHSHSHNHALASPANAAAAAAVKEQVGAGMARANSSGPFVDQLLSSALRSTPLAGAVEDECRSSLDLDSSSSFSRSQTDIGLEVGVRTVYRTSTQRLDLCKPSAPRVHGPT